MRFGAVPEEELFAIDLQLPQEPVSNTQVLPGKRLAAPKIYVGAATWGSSTWPGKVYPAKTPSARFRQLYPYYFNVIELDATHYTIYGPDVISKWALSAKGRDFKFCPKFPQQISHHSGFKNVETLTAAFLEGVRILGENLGPVFLQLSEHFSPANKTVLFQYLSSLPKEMVFFVELRHPGWFTSVSERQELFSILRQLQIGVVITDAPGRRDVVHMHLTLPTLFLRFVCNDVHATSFSRTDAWIKQLLAWIESGLEEAYIILHPGNDAAVPELVTYWIQQLNEQCQLGLKAPLVQAGLF